MAVGMLRSIWSYRGFISGSVKREFQSRYRNSLLGAAWTVLNPLAMIVVYTIIFSQVMKARLPGADNGFAYSIYLCAGVLTWGLFAEIVSRVQNVFLEHANLIKKINFPRLSVVSEFEPDGAFGRRLSGYPRAWPMAAMGQVAGTRCADLTAVRDRHAFVPQARRRNRG
jgi:hypothetical protein